ELDTVYGSGAFLPLVDGGHYTVNLMRTGALVARADDATEQRIRHPLGGRRATRSIQRLLVAPGVGAVLVVTPIRAETAEARALVQADRRGVVRTHLQPQPVATAPSRGGRGRLQQRRADAQAARFGSRRQRIHARHPAALAEKQHRAAEEIVAAAAGYQHLRRIAVQVAA